MSEPGLAMRFLDPVGPDRESSYADLSVASNKFAGVLSQLGVGLGQLVCGIGGRGPDL